MPTAYDSIDILSTAAMTTNVEILQSAPGLYRGLLPTRTEYHEAEQVEWGITRRARGTVPYIPVMAEGVFLGDRTREMKTIRGVNMTVQHAIKPGDLYSDRTIGQPIFSAGPQGRNRLQQRVNEYQADAIDKFEGNREWFLSQIITGSVSYSDDAYDAWTYVTGRSANNNIVLSDLWTTTAADPEEDLIAACKVAADAVFVNIVMGICSPAAAAAIRGNAKIRAMLDNRNLNERAPNGSFLDNTQPWMQQGAVKYIGMIAGVELWEYNQSLDAFGTLTPMVRPGYIELLPSPNQIDIRTHVFPIVDFEVNEGRPTPMERFSKSWDVKHPSQQRMMTQSRVIDMPHLPDATVSLKVA